MHNITERDETMETKFTPRVEIFDQTTNIEQSVNQESAMMLNDMKPDV